ncbi:MAG: hypothetical protein IJQ80_05405, partial [Clostridia bacterium]|nr:hypothetical protein [Clostridia bacterium]
RHCEAFFIGVPNALLRGGERRSRHMRSRCTYRIRLPSTASDDDAAIPFFLMTSSMTRGFSRG